MGFGIRRRETALIRGTGANASRSSRVRRRGRRRGRPRPAGPGSGAAHAAAPPQETARRCAAAWGRATMAGMKSRLVTPVPASFDTVTASIAKRPQGDLQATSNWERDRRRRPLPGVLHGDPRRRRTSAPWTYTGTFDLVVFDRHVEGRLETAGPPPRHRRHLQARFEDHLAPAARADRRLGQPHRRRRRRRVGPAAGRLPRQGDQRQDIAKLGLAYRKNQAIGRGGLQETFRSAWPAPPHDRHRWRGDTPLKIDQGQGGRGGRTSLGHEGPGTPPPTPSATSTSPPRWWPSAPRPARSWPSPTTRGDFNRRPQRPVRPRLDLQDGHRGRPAGRGGRPG